MGEMWIAQVISLRRIIFRRFMSTLPKLLSVHWVSFTSNSFIHYLFMQCWAFLSAHNLAVSELEQNQTLTHLPSTRKWDLIGTSKVFVAIAPSNSERKVFDILRMPYIDHYFSAQHCRCLVFTCTFHSMSKRASYQRRFLLFLRLSVCLFICLICLFACVQLGCSTNDTFCKCFACKCAELQ